jgi:hypothetical protein
MSPTNIAHNEGAYAALEAIDPDIFSSCPICHEPIGSEGPRAARQPGAGATLRERFQLFALGRMSHPVTDVAGRAFAHQKVGGLYRLYRERHHLVENYWAHRPASPITRTAEIQSDGKCCTTAGLPSTVEAPL